MIRYLTRGKRGKRGFTMMEVLVVVGIIAVIAAIAIPSVISMRKNMDYKQRCDYAKTIFLAAQSNLADLRSTGELDKLKDNKTSVVIQHGDDAADSSISQDFPNGDFSKRYVYTYHDPDALAIVGTPAAYFDEVLPVNAVESTIRDQQIIIEYNPRTGGVYSVFYAEDNKLVEKYQGMGLQRDEAWCKGNLVGYYNGEDLTGEEIYFSEVDSQMTYQNGQEGILEIKIGLQGIMQDGSLENLFEKIGVDGYVKGLEMKLTVIGESGGMFTSTIKEAGETIAFEREVDGKYVIISSALDSLIYEKSFAAIQENKNGQGYYVQPGDNVSLTLEVKFSSDLADAPDIVFDDYVLAGINPLFHSLTGDAGNYTIAISNGRHLQNLNIVAKDIAEKVSTITFVNESEPPAGGTDSDNEGTTGSETNAKTQTAIAQAAPEIDWKDTTSYYMEKHPGSNVTYFAPINNAGLFDTTQRTTAITIEGKKVEIRNIKVNDAKIDGALYVNEDGLRRYHVGLFRYVSGEIKDLRIVNPVIRGGSGSQAVGALAGSMNSAAKVSNCYVYVDTKADDFISTNLIINTTFDETDDTDAKYGVVGYAAVGGMIGDAGGATFTNCLASVPVFGNMIVSNNLSSDLGVGGFVGTTSGGSFTKCYSGTRTWAKGASAARYDFACGLGGFVGTSGISTFTDCFASGNVTSKSDGDLNACGGFVGVAKGTYSNGAFNSCYALGTVDNSSSYQAKFVGTTTTSGVVDRYKQILAGGSGYVYDGCYYLQGFGNTVNADIDTLPAGYNLLHDIHGINYETFEGQILASLRVTDPTLEDISKLQVAINGSGYRNGWTSGLNSKQNGNGHYPYMQGYQNANYPYSMLIDMPFYGVWPDAPSAAGIVYMELYEDGSKGYYYRDEDNATLKNDKTVVADGYVIICANGGSTVTVNNTPVTIDCSNTDTFDKNTYYYGALPDDIVASNSFYTKVEITDGGKHYKMYYNPNVAVSNVNPTGTNLEANNPGDAPEAFVIRSPRQLSALGSSHMNKYLNSEIILWGKIDYTKTSNWTLPQIGTFSGEITGEATITAKEMSSCLIGTLNDGSISGITLNVGSITLEDGEGALVNAINSGTISNCTVKGTVTGTPNAGLIVGDLNGGTISNTSFDGTNSSNLGFVGTAAKKNGSNMISSDANYVSSNSIRDGLYTMDQISKEGLAEIQKEEGSTLFKQEYAATITEDCKINGASVVTGEYYYSVSDENIYTTEKENSIKVVPQGKIALSNFGTVPAEWTKSPYYFINQDKLYPIYVKVETEIIREEVSGAMAASELDDNGQGEENQNNEPTQGGVSNQESGTTPTETIPPQTQPTIIERTVYKYQFSVDNGANILGKIDTQTPKDTVTVYDLYMIKMPVDGEYVFYSLANNMLSGTITDNMIWVLNAGVWTKKMDNTVTVNPELVVPVDYNYPAINVNGSEYYVIKVTGYSREVKLVDVNPIYSTTDSINQQPTDQP